MNEKRHINPQNPMRINRWRKMKQQVPHVFDPAKNAETSQAVTSPADEVAVVAPVPDPS